MERWNFWNAWNPVSMDTTGMLRSLLALFVVLVTSQAVETFQVSKSPLADVQQDTLQAVNAESKQTTEVFPGKYVSPMGAAVMQRIETLMGRVDEADRNALIASKATAGFDRSILRWRASANGRTLALAVRYYRDPLFRLELEMTDDYGRADPVDPGRYEFFAIATCFRMNADAWTCGEEQLAEVAGRYKMPLPQTRADRMAAAEKLVDLVLGGQ
jgi:hypothetical protein